MTAFTVVYDACVLYPAPLRDLLLQLATTRRFRAKWSDQIHEEWIGGILRNRPDLTRGQLEGTRRKMDAAVPDCIVAGYEALIPALTLPDPDDRHVLAVAIQARADAIITYNLKDFPQEMVTPNGLEAVHPDDFITSLLNSHGEDVVAAAQRCRKRLLNPPRSVADYLTTLEGLSLPRSIAILRTFSAIL